MKQARIFLLEDDPGLSKVLYFILRISGILCVISPQTEKEFSEKKHATTHYQNIRVPELPSRTK